MGSMTRREAVRLACSALLAAPFSLAACDASPASSGKGALRVGVRSDIVGFSSLRESNGKYYGFEIDVAEELSRRLGYDRADFSTVTPDDREDKLASGDVDCLVACYSDSESRRQKFDFSPAYYTDSIILVVEDTSLISGVRDLAGRTLGTLAGANTAGLLAKKFVEVGLSSGAELSRSADGSHVAYDGWSLAQYPTYQELSCALEAGEVDAMAMDGAIARTYLNDERQILPDFGINPQLYAVATQKGSELSGEVAQAVQAMLDDGTVASLLDKWD